MEAAKNTVKQFISKDGKHDTKYHEHVAPAVEQETVRRTQHEKEIAAVDREVHQDHYHTTEQPVTDKQTLAETHHHTAEPVEHRKFEHDDAEKINRSLEGERKQFYDTQTRVEGERTAETDPTVQGEHVHHHVHETIQPVVHKETVEPHVVHHTKPIHEVHHNEAHHHTATKLPPVSMEEFKKQGGALGGAEERVAHLDGEPRTIGGQELHQNGNARAVGTTDSVGADGSTKGATSDRIISDPHTAPK